MKVFITALVLIFSLQSWTKANDISDFEIEGISIGDSLLKLMSVNEITSSKRNYVAAGKKYYVVGYDKNLKNYEAVDIYLKTNDDKYIVRTISGMIIMNKSDCLKKRKEVVSELKQLFSSAVEKNYEGVSHSYDKDSKVYQTGFLLKNNNDDDHIRVECTDWTDKITKEKNWGDNLSVSAFTKEVLLWFASGYN